MKFRSHLSHDAVLLALVLPLTAFAGSPDRIASGGSGDRQVLEPERDEALADPLVPIPAGDCAFRGSADPDGAARRRAVSRATELFVSSHPSAIDPSANPIGGIDPGGYTGLVPRTAKIRHVNFVDDEIFGAIDAAKIIPAPLASDTEFLRRVTLDLTGRIPDSATVAAFVADTSQDKRAKQIDLLLASDAFADRWALFYDDQFRTSAFPASGSGRLGVTGRNQLHAYLLSSVKSGKGYDKIVRELLTGTGDTYMSGLPDFFLRDLQSNGPIQDTYDNQASTVGTVLLGTNAMFCTSCHNGAGHLDSINLWGSTHTRQDFWGMSAFFAKTQLTRIGANTPGVYDFNVADSGTRDYSLMTSTGNKAARQPCTASNMPNCNLYATTPPGITTISPSFILNGGKPGSGETYRAAMARLVTADPQFAKAAVNYIWKELFALGIVEPADAFDLSRQDPGNPPPGSWTIQPSHPDLLVKLGQTYASSGFDLRALLRTITSSSAYQLSSFYPGTWSDSYTNTFARHFVRQLGAEMMVDAITKATGVVLPLPVQGFPSPVSWAVQLPDTSEPAGGASVQVRTFLDTFQRGNRDDEPRSYESSISEALFSLNNATVVTNRIKSTVAGSTVGKLKAANANPQTIVNTLYLSTLSRYPASSENAIALGLFNNLTGGQTTWTVAEDLQFALLNKLDFLLKY